MNFAKLLSFFLVLLFHLLGALDPESEKCCTA
jgi:hypothetical protein